MSLMPIRLYVLVSALFTYTLFQVLTPQFRKKRKLEKQRKAVKLFLEPGLSRNQCFTPGGPEKCHHWDWTYELSLSPHSSLSLFLSLSLYKLCALGPVVPIRVQTITSCSTFLRFLISHLLYIKRKPGLHLLSGVSTLLVLCVHLEKVQTHPT